MAYEELLDWSKTRSDWQQDALRRVAIAGEISDDDLTQLKSLIEHAAGLPVEAVVEPMPLEAAHLVGTADGEDLKTALTSLGPVRHVDRLADDQPPLQFAVNGVTIVYGANASGKSGYCRIAKQLCRSHSPVDLRGNVFADANPNPPEVAFAYALGDDPDEKTDVDWVNGDAPPEPLLRISVFDTASARVYVDKERKIEFLPFELDLMNKLGLTCRALDVEFQQREAVLDRIIAVPLPSAYTEGTTVHAAVAKLTPDTALQQIPNEDDLRALADWNDEKQAELQQVAAQLEGDPKEQARLRKEAKRSLEVVKRDIEKGLIVVGDNAIAELIGKKSNAEAKSKAVEDTAKELFEQQPISDLGSDTWRQMLSYAREFAATVYDGEDPPQLATGDRCVLCQQELSDEASTRLSAFDEFIVGRAAEESEAAHKVFLDHKGNILDTGAMSKEEVEALLAGYSALADPAPAHAPKIIAFVEHLNTRLETVKNALRGDDWDALAALSPLGETPIALIDAEISRLETEIETLEETDRDEDALAALKIRLAELSDQKLLSQAIDVVVERRDRLAERCRVKTCRKECAWGLITRRITTRRREILTPSLRIALRDELKKLKLTHIPIDLSDRGEGTDSIIEIELSARQRVANNSDILSEGEQRALALACFLAELNETQTMHSIIVDDPVSSLDHTRMEAVAKRLAEEAQKGRQVIVFTHNILFHYMMMSEVRGVQVARHTEWMCSMGEDQFGIIDETQKPWHVKKVPERLSDLTTELGQIKKDGYDPNDQNNRPVVIGLYTRMRETWERIVEDVLLNGVVQRFRPEVMTMRLETACIDPNADYPIIFEGMRRCSHYSGHDRAEDLPAELPGTDVIEGDLQQVNEFFQAARDRQKKLEKAPKYEAGVAPKFL